MAKKYNLDKLHPAVNDNGNANPSKENMAEIADLFRERGTENDDGKLSSLLGLDEKQETVISIPLSDTRPFGNDRMLHRFRLNEEKVAELSESIADVGVLVPIIVRQDPEGKAKYEVLAGMTRRAAAMKAGLDSIPAIVRSCDDEEAELIMVASNHQREDLLPTEKGWMYRIEYEAMKRQGKRSDLTSDQVGQKLENKYSIDELAERSEDSRNQIQRFIRTTHLIKPLADLVDEKKMPLVAAVDLSYLSGDEQEHVRSVMFADQIKMSSEIAAALKSAARDKDLDLDTVHNICADLLESKPTPDKKYAVPEILFPKEVKKKERADYVIRALEYIRDNGIEV